ncbi:hypothetical protein BGZ79_004980, partial [Entomortierella chlamydospora]
MADAKQEGHSPIRQSNDLIGMTLLPRTEITWSLESNLEVDSTSKNEIGLASSRSSNDSINVRVATQEVEAGIESSSIIISPASPVTLSTNRGDCLGPDKEPDTNATAPQTITKSSVDKVDGDQEVPQCDGSPGGTIPYATKSTTQAVKSTPDPNNSSDSCNNQTQHLNERYGSSIRISDRTATGDNDARDMEVEYTQGCAYFYGKGDAQDYSKAFECFLKAANQGHIDSHNKLGYMYDNGLGIKQDSVAALKWYQIAADNGYATSQYILGIKYQEGQGVPKDYIKAVEWYQQA